MAITGSTDLGNGLLLVTVDQDPIIDPVNVPSGSIIVDPNGKMWAQSGSGILSVTSVIDTSLETKEPTGLVDKTQSNISFLDSSGIFSISPVSGSFDFYIKGVLYTINTSQTIPLSDTEGIHYIYFNGYILSETTSYSDSLITDNCIIADVYWDSSNNKSLFLMDERHGCAMDTRTHLYLHNTVGPRWASGLDLENINLGDGSSDSHCELSIKEGMTYDEDLIFNISPSLYPAQIPTLYKDGTNWRIDTSTNFPAKQFVGGSGRLAYNYL